MSLQEASCWPSCHRRALCFTAPGALLAAHAPSLRGAVPWERGERGKMNNVCPGENPRFISDTGQREEENYCWCPNGQRCGEAEGFCLQSVPKQGNHSAQHKLQFTCLVIHKHWADHNVHSICSKKITTDIHLNPILFKVQQHSGRTVVFVDLGKFSQTTGSRKNIIASL